MNFVNMVDPNGNSVLGALIGFAVMSLLTWGLGEIFGHQLIGGIGSAAGGIGAVVTGVSLMAFGPIGWVLGGLAIISGAACIAFGSAEIQQHFTGDNWLQNLTGMGNGLYDALYFASNLLSAASAIGGNFYKNYANMSGTANPGLKGKPFSRYTTYNKYGKKQYRFFNIKGEAWYDKDFAHTGFNLTFPHYHVWENGIKLNGHWTFWELTKWFLWKE